MAELTDGGFVGHRLVAEINTHKMPHGEGVVQCLFRPRVGQTEPVLQEVDAQHALNPHRATARTLRIRIERLNDLSEFLSRDYGFHLFQKLFLTGLLAVLFEAFCQRGLSHA